VGFGAGVGVGDFVCTGVGAAVGGEVSSGGFEQAEKISTNKSRNIAIRFIM